MSGFDLAFKHLTPGNLIVVGVSGGPDSVALLHYLFKLQYPILVASFNHCLRQNSDNDVIFVRQFADKLGLPFVTDSADVAFHASSYGKSIEEAARELRYQFLFREARKNGAQAVVVGHTTNDQSETVLMHFLRGAGIAGLKGMPPRIILPIFDSEIPLVRPLLNWSREETQNYCDQNGLEVLTDQSNFDLAFFRNRLRHELIPYLKEYNPQINNTLAKTAVALQGDFELIEELVDSEWRETVKNSGVGYIEFNLVQLKKLKPALLRYLFRRGAALLKPGLRDIDFETLERAAKLKPVELAGGLRTFIEVDRLFLTNDEGLLPTDRWPLIDHPIFLSEGDFELKNNWYISCHQIAGTDLLENASNNTNNFIAWIDQDIKSGIFSLRTYHSGDHFEPLGMPHQTVKLSELYINEKIPKRLRPHWPILFINDEIAWVAGLRFAEGYKLTDETRSAVKIELYKKETGRE